MVASAGNMETMKFLLDIEKQIMEHADEIIVEEVSFGDDFASLQDIVGDYSLADSVCKFVSQAVCDFMNSRDDFQHKLLVTQFEIDDEGTGYGFHAAIQVEGHEGIIDFTIHQFTYESAPMVFPSQLDWESFVYQQIEDNFIY